ncbi:MAG: glycosyltransferase family 9 protein [Candidatus Omnitrophica bacterium]|nr:glycosyltransferase family 9 protein [Candidatus Omnitrophota bacterium]
MKKALIIKLGYSETLEDGISQDVSFGDVLRTTFILHFFKDYHVSWLADKKALPLLVNNPYINNILLWNSGDVKKIKGRYFDIVVNFEKLKDIYILIDSLKIDNFFGFSLATLYDKQRHSLGSRKLFKLSESIEDRRKNKFCWQKILAEIINKKWKGEKYILGYKPRSNEQYDIGFNWTVSKRWTNKAWPKGYWNKLEDLIKGKYSVSWQQGHNNLYEYMEWINSCRLIVTADTLGLHLALALKKKAIGLFGPTSPREIFFYNSSGYLLPDFSCNCMPCFMPNCKRGKPCIEYIFPEKVKNKIDEEITQNTNSLKV